MSVRALRGATTIDVDEPEHLTERVQELVSEVMQSNGLVPDDLISVIFTATKDVRSKFPETAARQWGLDDVPLLGAQVLDVETSLPLCIRLMAHVETDKPRSEMHHVCAPSWNRSRLSPMPRRFPSPCW